MSKGPVIVEKSFHASPEKIWKAISDKDEMKQWYFDLAEFRPEVGFEFSFVGETEDRKKYVHLCEVTEAVPYKKLSYSWRYEGYPGISFVTFELVPEGNSTKVRLTHSGLESFEEANNPDIKKENFEKGWNDIIGTLLKNYLEKDHK